MCIHLTSKQNGRDIGGGAKILKTYNGLIEYNQEFFLSGLIYEGYVILNLKSSNNKSLALSTGIFQIQDRGNLLNGTLSYRVRIGDGIGSESISFNKLNLDIKNNFRNKGLIS